MQLIGEMPLSALGELLSYAGEKEAEEAIRPLWIAHFMLAKMGNAEVMPYDELLRSIMNDNSKQDTVPVSAPDEIEARIMKYVEADKMRSKEV